MSTVLTLFERLRNSFWALPAIGIGLAVVAAFGLTAVDDSVELPGVISFNGPADTARSLLQVIVTIAVSVAGISFSVIVVALVLASQQLSPRVLGSFQRHPLNQFVLGVYLGTATFTLFVLARIEDDNKLPETAITTAMLLGAISLALFGFFVHHIVRSLNASAVIRRIAADGHDAIDAAYPAAVGRPAPGTDVDGLTRGTPIEVRAPRAGYLASVDGTRLLAAAEAADGFVEQRTAIGEFTVTGGLLALAWCDPAHHEDLERAVADACVIHEERLVDNDVSFPIRQLCDIALKGLSPGINDPTTAENAMDSVTDTLVRFALQPEPVLLRATDAGTARLRARSSDLDDLVRLGFDQVRRDGAARASFAVRLLELLADLRECGGDRARHCAEIDRQALLIREQATTRADIEADAELVEAAYERRHGTGRRAELSR